MEFTEGRGSSTSWGAGISSPASSKFSGTYLRQSVVIGLPLDSSIGIADSYIHSLSSSTGVPSDTEINGFTSPTIFAAKTWGGNSDLRLRLALNATPKTDFGGAKDVPANYSISANSVFIGQSGIISSLGVSRTVNEGDTSINVTNLGGDVYKEFGLYSASVSANFFWLDARKDADVQYENPVQFNASATVGRKLSNTTSMALTYTYLASDSQVRLNNGTGGVSSTFNQNNLRVSVLVLF